MNVYEMCVCAKKYTWDLEYEDINIRIIKVGGITTLASSLSFIYKHLVT